MEYLDLKGRPRDMYAVSIPVQKRSPHYSARMGPVWAGGWEDAQGHAAERGGEGREVRVCCRQHHRRHPSAQHVLLSCFVLLCGFVCFLAWHSTRRTAALPPRFLAS
eukprot:2082865-Rhodomonas_salina.1